MVEGGMKCIKYLLFGFNLIFFLTGLGLMILGGVVKAKFNDMFTIFSDSSFSSVAIALIAVGCLIFIIGFLGCCGAVKENYCMVMTFAVLVSLLFVVQLAVGIAGFVMRKKVETALKDHLQKSMPQYENAKAVKKVWDLIQNKFECCGVVSSKDWKSANATFTVPVSCCKKDKQDDTKCMDKPANVQTDGCYAKMKDWLEGNIYIVAGVGVGLAFIQIIGVIFACCLARTIKKEYEVV